MLVVEPRRRGQVGGQVLRRRRGLGHALCEHPDLRLRHERHPHRPLGQLAERPVRPDRRGEHQDAPTHDAGDPAHGLAEQQGLTSPDRDGPPGQPTVERGHDDLHELRDRDRADRPLAEPDRREERHGLHGVAEVVDEVVPVPVDHPGLEHGVVEARGADELLRRPLRLVVRRAGARTGAQEAQQDDALHPGPPGGLEHGCGAVDVHALEGLVADLAVDARAVRHGLDPGERRGQGVDVVDRHSGAPGHHDDVLGRVPLGEVSSDEPRPTRDRDPHRSCSPRVHASCPAADTSASRSPPVATSTRVAPRRGR